MSATVSLTARTVAALGVLALSAGCARDPERPNVLLITLDTTRADRLGCYGHARDTSPSLDALAAEALVYTRAYGASSWTLPSHASLFTGQYPTTHGAQYDPEGPLRVMEVTKEGEHFATRALGPEARTLAEVLRDAGYATGAFVSGPWMKKVFGLDQGFEVYDDRDMDPQAGRLAASATAAALEWLRPRAERPFFLFLNYFDPHTPFLPPEGFRQTFLAPGTRPTDLPKEEMWNVMYDSEIRYVDHHVGLLLAELRRLGVYENTLIVVTADHGELMGEGGRWGHAESLWEGEIRVPLIVKAPGARPGSEERPVQQVDVLALVLAAVGLPVPAGSQGHAQPGTGPVFAEVRTFPTPGSEGTWMALIDGPYKLIHTSAGRRALFHVADDPGEERDLLAREPERARAMEEKLLELARGLPRPVHAGGEQILDEETSQALKALGYVDSEK